MKKLIFIVLLCMGVCLYAAAEPMAPKASLTGKVTDAVDNSALVGVAISISELSQGVTTDARGNYSFHDLPMRTVTLQVSYLGHQTIIRKVDLSKTASMDFVMKESNASLNEVVVTGLTGKSLMKQSPTPVSVVSTQQLHASSSTNIIDAISREPGLSQITTGGGISKPVIRGLGFNRLVVVNDGIRQEGNQWGAEHGIEIDAQSISSAEILKGPASLMYGSDALAGVIIFHGNPVMARNTMQANVSSEYQTNNGLFDYSVNFSGNHDGFVWDGRWSDKMAHAYKNKYDNYVLGTQFRERAANALLGVNKSWGYSHLILDYYHLTPGITEGERGYSHSYSESLPFQQIHHYKAVLDNSFYIGEGTLRALVGYQQNRRQEFEESADVPGLDMQLHTLNYDIKYLYPEHDGWKFVTGVNGMYQRNINKGDEYLIPSYQLFDIGVFGTTSYQTGDFTFSGGLRLDHRHLHSFALDGYFDRFTRNFTSVSGSVGIVYALRSDMNLRLNLARGFRAPNLGELASNGVHEGTQQYVMGNSDLKPEHSWQIDAGWDYSSAWLSAQLSLFANFIDNYIFDHRLEGVTTEGYSTYQYIQGNARLLGGEAAVDIHPIERLHFQNTFSYVNSVQLHQPAESRYLPWTPAPRWTSDLRYDLIRDGKVLDHAYVSASIEHDFRQDHYYAADNTETVTPAYTLLNLAAGTDLKCHSRRWASVYLTANNILDCAYQNHLSRLKYLGENPANGRMGIYNMGRNFGMKLVVYIL
jgi:iron complex outermembrane receptor protein